MFIFVMLNIVFEDGQYHNEHIKLGIRINAICFESMYNAHNLHLHGMLALLLRFLLPTALKLCGFSFNNSIFSVVFT